MAFDNTYARLPDHFFQRTNPQPVREPGLIQLNRELAESLGLDLPESEDELAAVFAGNQLLPGSDPISLAYAGHQFGGFVPQLGDGRAVLLGEVVDGQGLRFDIQLKGSGQTYYSRNGDGRSAIGPVIREYVVSEAMHALGVPTSRALAMVTTGEKVRRETMLPGGVFTRVAASHVRVGTFEYFASRKDEEAVRHLADYVIDRHYPEAREAENPYAMLFELVCKAQARLVAKWMTLGFIHGVMNTDNTTISGETIDYGPCAFMDAYNPAQVFSSIDHQGRYAYNNQPTIARWNMACLGGCLLPLLHEDNEQANKIGEVALDSFVTEFKSQYQPAMSRKVGLAYEQESDFDLVKELLELMHRDHVDFTLAFRRLDVEDSASFEALFSSSEPLAAWLASWRERLEAQGTGAAAAWAMMQSVNPAFIPRNHRVEQAIQAAEKGDFSLTHTLVDIFEKPFSDQPEFAEYMAPPEPEEIVHQTFCGT